MNIVDEEETTTKTFPINYSGKIYASLEAYNDDASPIGGFNGRFELDIDDDNIQYNIIKQCYLHLKTTDDFTDAIDA